MAGGDLYEAGEAADGGGARGVVSFEDGDGGG